MEADYSKFIFLPDRILRLFFDRMHRVLRSNNRWRGAGLFWPGTYIVSFPSSHLLVVIHEWTCMFEPHSSFICTHACVRHQLYVPQNIWWGDVDLVHVSVGHR